MLHASRAAAADRGHDRWQAIVLDQSVTAAGGYESVEDLIALELAAGNKLKEPEGDHVERVIAPARASSVAVRFAKDGRWQTIPIRWTRCNFGGQRPWLECPCGRRVGKLYDSGFCFGCRQCLNLIYECQRRGPNIRRYLGVCKLRAHCGGAPSLIEPFPNRPSGMRRKAYWRMKSRAELLENDLHRSPRFMKRARYYAQKAQYSPFFSVTK